ncbi:hypothetical protein RCL1_006328 [Eukaryota sp. TZLM3-RCL]
MNHSSLFCKNVPLSFSIENPLLSYSSSCSTVPLQQKRPSSKLPSLSNKKRPLPLKSSVCRSLLHSIDLDQQFHDSHATTVKQNLTAEYTDDHLLSEVIIRPSFNKTPLKPPVIPQVLSPPASVSPIIPLKTVPNISQFSKKNNTLDQLKILIEKNNNKNLISLNDL